MSADYSFAIRKGQRTGFRRRHRSFSHGARGLVDVVFGAQNVIWVTEMIEANGPHYYQKPLKKLIFSARDTENSIPNQLARSAKEGPRQILRWFPTSLNQTGRKPSLRFGLAPLLAGNIEKCWFTVPCWRSIMYACSAFKVYLTLFTEHLRFG